MTQVTFHYSEREQKWQTYVTGANDAQDAKDAFTAVLKTCGQINVDLQQRWALARPTGAGWEITPAITEQAARKQ